MASSSVNRDTWDTADMQVDNQAFWFMRITERCLNAIRELGIPSEETVGRIRINIPTLLEQAEAQRPDDTLPLSKVYASGVIKFYD